MQQLLAFWNWSKWCVLLIFQRGVLAQVHRAKNTVENKAQELSSGCIQTFFYLIFLFSKIRPVSSRRMLKQGISMVFKAYNLFLFACFLLLGKYLRGTWVCVSPVEVFLWSCSPMPTSLINVLENGRGLCCSRPWFILCGGSVSNGDEPIYAGHVWILVFFPESHQDHQRWDVETEAGGTSLLFHFISK